MSLHYILTIGLAERLSGEASLELGEGVKGLDDDYAHHILCQGPSVSDMVNAKLASTLEFSFAPIDFESEEVWEALLELGSIRVHMLPGTRPRWFNELHEDALSLIGDGWHSQKYFTGNPSVTRDLVAIGAIESREVSHTMYTTLEYRKVAP